MRFTRITRFDRAHFDAARRLAGLLAPDAAPMTESYFEAMVLSPSSRVFFLSDGDSVAGMLTLGVYPTPTGMKAWIEDVVVDPSLRGRGLGRLMVEHALRFARSEGLSRVMLTSNPSRVEANELYRSMGFRQKTTNVYLYESD
jgi:ribosomal protein S18 acetylase RimI-like enzyme